MGTSVTCEESRLRICQSAEMEVKSMSTDYEACALKELAPYIA